MRDSIKSGLNIILDLAMPIGLAGGAVLASELSGLSETVRNYNYAKIQLVTQYFGGAMGAIQNCVAHISRVGADIAAGLLGLGAGMLANSAIEYIRCR